MGKVPEHRAAAPMNRQDWLWSTLQKTITRSIHQASCFLVGVLLEVGVAC